MTKIFLLDNHDSFTYNLASMFNKYQDVDLHISYPESTNIAKISDFDKIIFSPGPGLPSESKTMFEILSKYSNTHPILGVCLGHQAIGEFYGAKLKNMSIVNHGMNKNLHYTSSKSSIYKEIPDKSEIGVYHSWYISKNDFPKDLNITGLNAEDKIMSIEHKYLPIIGLQFHPESFITKYGFKMIENWIKT